MKPTAYDFANINGGLIQCVIQKKIKGYYVSVRVLDRTVPKYLKKYEIEKNSEDKPCRIRKYVRDDEKFFGTLFTREDLHLNFFRSMDLHGKDDMYEFMFGDIDKDGNVILHGNITDSLGIEFDDLFSDDATIIPVVQELDEDGNVLREENMSKEEFEEFLKTEAGIKDESEELETEEVETAPEPEVVSNNSNVIVDTEAVEVFDAEKNNTNDEPVEE